MFDSRRIYSEKGIPEWWDSRSFGGTTDSHAENTQGNPGRFITLNYK